MYEKAGVTLLHFLGNYMQQKKVGWEVIFSELGLAGSRVRKPRQDFDSSALKLFFVFFWGLMGLQLCS